jgi:hypothetical protein
MDGGPSHNVGSSILIRRTREADPPEGLSLDLVARLWESNMIKVLALFDVGRWGFCF